MAYLPGCGGVQVVLRHPHSLSDSSKERLSIAFNKFLQYNIFGILIPNTCAPAKGEIRMSDTEKLMNYILSLTPEQVDKVVSQLPRLTELLEESLQPCPQELTERIA